jgi:HlyD family secretion protein
MKTPVTRWVRRAILLVLVLGIAYLGYWGYESYRQSTNAPPVYRFDKVTRGPIMTRITATGTLQPIEVVTVAAQVTGRVEYFGRDPSDNDWPVATASLLADLSGLGGPLTAPCGFYERLATESLDRKSAVLRDWHVIDMMVEVDKDTVLAQIDDALPRTAAEQARLAVRTAEANVAQYRATSTLNGLIYDRNKRLYESGNLDKETLDTSKANYETSQATLAGGLVSIDLAKANLKQAEINLGYTTIRSPVRGTVITKQVTVGQTVVSGLSASPLFLVARDLRQMLLVAQINESDIGHIHEGQDVTFTFDTFANQEFHAKVTKVRNDASVTQNVVTFPVEITVDNRYPDGRLNVLIPYATANLQIKIAERPSVLQVPNAALRYRPPASRVHPDARDEYEKTLRKRAAAANTSGPPSDEPSVKQAVEKAAHNKATVWVKDGDFVKPVRLKIGLSDGVRTEVLPDRVEVLPDGRKEEHYSLKVGEDLVTGEEEVAAGGGDAKSPFAPPPIFGKKK